MSYRKPTADRRNRRLLAEPLETRRLFFTLTIEGTSVADTISIGMSGNSILYVVNGVSDTASNVLYDDIVINANGGSDTITVVENDDANQLVVNGGAGNDTLNLGLGTDFAKIGDGITFNGGDATDSLRVFNGGVVGSNAYVVRSTQFFLSTDSDPIGYSTVEDVTIDMGPFGNICRVESAPGAEFEILAGTAFTSDTDTLSFVGSGSDAITVVPSFGTPTATWGSHSIVANGIGRLIVEQAALVVQTPSGVDNITVGVTGTSNLVDGTSGSDSLSKITVRSLASFRLDLATNDGLQGGPADFVTINSPWTASSKIDYQGGSGPDTITLNASASIDTSFGALAGQNVRFNVNNATLTLVGNESLLKLNLSGDNAVVRFTGTGALSVVDFDVNGSSTSLFVPAGRTLNVSGQFRFLSNSDMRKEETGTLNLLSTVLQTYQLNTSISMIAGTINFGTDTVLSSNATRTLSLAIFGGQVNALASFHAKDLSVLSGLFTLPANGTRVLAVDELQLGTPDGSIDLRDNTLLVINPANPAAALAHVEQKVRSGFSNGTWNGIGIRTSRTDAVANSAIGFGAASEVMAVPGTFQGHAVTANTAIARFTIDGDATLDRTVNFDDLLKLASSYNGTGKRWSQGDFTFDTATNFDDLLKLASKYNQSLPGAFAPVVSANGPIEGDMPLRDLLS